MSSLKELKNRICSLKETQKITEAMRMVAISSLRRAQTAMKDASLYQSRIQEFLRIIEIDIDSDGSLPALVRGTGKDKTYLLIICAAEKGLCGGFNSQIIRFSRDRIEEFIAEGKKVKILVVGKKGYEILSQKLSSMIIDYVKLSSKQGVDFIQAHNISRKVMSLFQNDVFDSCFCIYSEFKSVIQQVPVMRKLIPVDLVQDFKEGKDKKSDISSVYDYESTLHSVLKKLLFQNISAQLFQVLLENGASEVGARITAMDNATRSAGRMVEDLVVSYNRQRQVRITTELIEIISGAEAV
ncbi:F0F1 ATP synthase subunit gamma [Candidatus Liberibacter sp.]|uniref:F0F1 ATP synthase subunit gamma n=1 Tax=Candidatus Liberibacter sp. TaxID=34022 RepID=UPI0015F45824|nr:F0F1 ATP synthase subunit gamma [Candidatus Liberibacter sp.]MBA5723684.1 F0F1 ATP synthase subunit gamma [Candidatus Liberibacter sp.]